MWTVVTLPVSNFGVGIKDKGLSEYKGALGADIVAFDVAGAVERSHKS